MRRKPSKKKGTITNQNYRQKTTEEQNRRVKKEKLCDKKKTFTAHLYDYGILKLNVNYKTSFL